MGALLLPPLPAACDHVTVDAASFRGIAGSKPAFPRPILFTEQIKAGLVPVAEPSPLPCSLPCLTAADLQHLQPLPPL
jgi:hypothetical protein